MKSFFIETYGCQMNKADSTGIAESLIDAGFYEVSDNNQAEIILINTCSVRQTAENRIWGRLGYYKNHKKKNDSIIILIGCMAQRLGEELLAENNTVDIVIGTFYRDKIPYILSNHKKGERCVFVDEKSLEFGFSTPDKKNQKKAFVTISYGCDNFCSYCIVPYLRGRERSRTSSEIIEDINQLTDKGVIQVTLLGQNVNSYGKDIKDLSFPELLKKISGKTDIKWIKYLSSHPKDFTDELIDVIGSDDKVANHLHLAVQSGSNNVLKKMNRHYSIESYINKIKSLRKTVRNINITTDIIVGFPGESDNDYMDTYNLVRELRFDDAYMYKYNPRSGTRAFDVYKDDVSAQEKTMRLSKIIDLQRKISLEKKKERIGDIFDVIPEKWSKRSKQQMLGLTKEDLTILFNDRDSDFNGIVKVKSTGLAGSTLSGEKIDEIVFSKKL